VHKISSYAMTSSGSSRRGLVGVMVEGEGRYAGELLCRDLGKEGDALRLGRRSNYRHSSSPPDSRG
jgi:hypothetical protein